jgi:hypothetical protein
VRRTHHRTPGPSADRAALYSRLLGAFREAPGATVVAAKKAGTTRETAKRAWERGWPGLPAIQIALEEEKLEVRAAVYTEDARKLAGVRAREVLETATAGAKRERDAAKEEAAAIIANAEKQARERMGDLLRKAKLDSAQAIADRAQMLNLGRKSTIGAVALTALVFQNVQDIAKIISTAIKEGQFKSPTQAIAAGVMLTRMVENSERALLLHIQTENLEAGKPTEILQVQDGDGGEVESLEETEKELKQMQLAVERVKQKAAMTLVQGGKASGTSA